MPNGDKFFAGIHFYLDSVLPEKWRASADDSLTEHGATVAEGVETANLIITSSIAFEGRHLAQEDAHIVTIVWLDHCLGNRKLMNPKYYSPDPAKFMSGIIATASDLPPNDVEAIAAGMNAYGGQWRHEFTKEVTHLFALAPQGPKYRIAMTHKEKLTLEVLIPAWFQDCLQLQRILPTGPYSFPNPALYKTGAGLNPIGADPEADSVNAKLRLVASTSDKGALFRTIMEAAGEKAIKEERKKKSNLWAGRKVLLADDLALGADMLSNVETSITRNGGQVVRGEDNLENADALICRFRYGPVFTRAGDLSIMIGTVGWVFHVEQIGRLTRPLEHLVHFPIPRYAIKGFEGVEVTVTNYTGDSREYIKWLVQSIGAKFSATMSRKTAFVIAAHLGGTKVARAQDWHIPIVNHLWVEDCFLEWKMRPIGGVGTEKYSLFPTGVNFMEILGDRGFMGYADVNPMMILGDPPEMTVSSSASTIAVPITAIESTTITRGIVVSATTRAIETENHSPLPVDPRAQTVSEDEVMPRQAAIHGTAFSDLPSSHTEPRRSNGKAVSRPSLKEPAHTLSDIDSPSLPIAGKSGAQSVTPTKKKTPLKRKAGDEGDQSLHPPSKASEDHPPSPIYNRTPYVLVPLPKRGVTRTTSETSPKLGTTRRVESQPGSSSPLKRSHTAPNPVGVASSSEDDAPPPSSTPRRPPPLSKPTSVVKKRSKPKVPSPPPPPPPPDQSGAESDDSADPLAAPSSSKAFSVQQSGSSVASDVPNRGRRAAATKAEAELRNVVMPDLLNYQKQMKATNGDVRKPGFGGSKKRERDAEEDEPGQRVAKRPTQGWSKAGKRAGGKASAKAERRGADEDEPMSEDDEDEEMMILPTNGKGKGKATAQVARAGLTSGYNSEDSSRTGEDGGAQKFVIMATQCQFSEAEEKSLKAMGAKITTDPLKCTHLVVKRVVRTIKFICAVGRGIPIVTMDWVKKSIKQKRFLDPALYLPHDPEAEAKHNFKLKSALESARAAPIFKRHLFYITPNIEPKFPELKQVVMACGGQVTKEFPKERLFAKTDVERHIVSVPEDRVFWAGMVKNGQAIYTKDILLDSALRQEVDWAGSRVEGT